MTKREAAREIAKREARFYVVACVLAAAYLLAGLCV